jgi:hypothetical protein
MVNMNSFSAFACSVRRAAPFKEVQPVLRTLQLSDEGEVTEEHRHREHEEVPPVETGMVEEERDDSQFPGQMRNLQNGQQKQPDEQTALLDNNKPQGDRKTDSGLTPLR